MNVDSLFVIFLIMRFARNRGWAQQLYWDKDALVGTDPLNDSLMVLWGLLRGVFGVTPSLHDIRFARASLPAELEGSRWTFSHLGRRVSVCVVNRTSQECS